MAAFDTYSDIASKSLTSLLGIDITIIDTTDDSERSMKAIYDDAYFDSYDAQVPVLLDKPSFLIRDRDIEIITDDHPLPRSQYIIRRDDTGDRYRVINYERDDKSTVRYVVELIRDSAS